MVGRKRSWSDEQLVHACGHAESLADVCRELGLSVTGGTYQHLHLHMTRLGLTIQNHNPWAWMRQPGANTGGRPMALEEILVNPSTYTSSGRLRQRLVKAGLKELRCEQCGLTEWLGKPVAFELDHVDGNRANNRLDNLRMLCPNCHAQTETWCRKRTNRPT